MPESAIEEVSVTAALKGNLNGYPGNSSFFREVEANSDDAGATTQMLILDERQHGTSSLIDPILQDSQGPALIAVNDGILTERDSKALRTINSSSKTNDENQTGKYGLGFRASYHFTENPHILSEDKLLILDPHRRFSKFPGGARINTITECAEYRDQVSAFSDFIRDPPISYPGTVFRFPLRTKKQADISEIKNMATSTEEMRTLLEEFGTNELEENILFLKNILEIDIRRITSDGCNTRIGKVSITKRPSGSPDSYTRKTTLIRGDGRTEVREWQFVRVQVTREEANRLMSKRLGYDVGGTLAADKLVPIVELAVPLDDKTIRGSLYTLLPIPVKTGFPVHINAVFALAPDRQSLKNIEEVGMPNSREKRLVEWNKLILDTWVPDAWATMLKVLSHTGRSWSIWPFKGDGYLKNVLPHITRLVVERNMEVFPIISEESQASLVKITDSKVLLATSSPSIPLMLLSKLGLRVVQPPAHILEGLIDPTLSKGSATLLSPSALQRLLMTRGSHLPPSSIGDISSLVEYLVFSDNLSSPDLHNIVGLPWFRLASGDTVSFERAGAKTLTIMSSSDEEIRLFADHARMLEPSSLPDKLREVLLRPASTQKLNVSHLNEQDVYFALSVAQGKVGVEWVIKFLTWIADWSKRASFFQRYKSQIDSFRLLPSSENTLLKLSGKAAHIDDNRTRQAWCKLGVPVLLSTLPDAVVSLLVHEDRAVPSWKANFVPFLLETCNTGLLNHLASDEYALIERSMYQACVGHPLAFPSSSQKAKIAKLPIFKVRNVDGGSSYLSTVIGTPIYVNVSDDFPLPIRRANTYVDLRSHSTGIFADILDRRRNIETAADLLLFAVNNWSMQTETLQDRFINYIFDTSSCHSRIKPKLKHLRFIVVNGTKERASPERLVDPNSIIAPLFKGETGRLPIDRFADKSYIRNLQNFGFLPATLTVDILRERLSSFSGSSRAGSTDTYAFGKAKSLFELLNEKFWSAAFADVIAEFRDSPWLPSVQETLVAPSSCRDSTVNTNLAHHTNPRYYDLTLDVIATSISATRSQLRVALGWTDCVPVRHLLTQLRKTIALEDGIERTQRLDDLIAYLNFLYEKRLLAPGDIADLRNAVNDHAWVPTPTRTSAPTKFALLDETNLKPPFYFVAREGTKRFLSEMGCQKRPNSETLIRELPEPASLLNSYQIEAVVALLDELAKHHSNALDGILIPGADKRCYKKDEVYYPNVSDDGFISKRLQGKIATHRSISLDLSDRLGIALLSSIALYDDDDEDEQMGEDLEVRIRGFLREYDIRYAFNETLANADDAKASEVSVQLDCRRKVIHGDTISPQFKMVLSRPSLMIFNDALMTKEDFRGLVRVGQGGKAGQFDTHGRHGLGSLSFYYFTDVVTVISGDNVSILNPSGNYLPKKGGNKRTSVTLKITELSSRFPNQLAPFDGIFGFRQSASRFGKGTLFCLPLSLESCSAFDVQTLLQSNYDTLAKNAFFFTNTLRKISADIVEENGRKQQLWCFSARIGGTTPGCSRHLTLLKEGERKPEEWLIFSSKACAIPEEHKSTAADLKLTDMNSIVQIAIPFKPEPSRKPSESWFFSTLRLPKSSNLPFHLHARFALSSNRQAIVFDSPDGRNHRDPKSSLNAWILAELVPPLYLKAMEHCKQSLPADTYWWLTGQMDELSKHISVGFHEALIHSDAKVLQTTTGCWVSFKNAIFGDDIRRIDRCLRLLQPPHLVTSHLLSRVPDLPTARKVDSDYIVEALRRPDILNHIITLFDEKKLKLEDLLALLSGIENAVDLVGLPLLLLSTNHIMKIPDRNQPVVHLSKSETHAQLFSNSHFLSTDYAAERFDHFWSSPALNVVALECDHIESLVRCELDEIQAGRDREAWLKLFWATYKTLPGPPSIDVLENADVPVIRSASGRHFTLRQCQTDEVVYFPISSNRETYSEIGSMLSALRIEVIKSTGNVDLNEFLSRRFPSPIINILKCLAKSNITTFDGFPRAEADLFTRWLRDEINGQLYSWARDDPKIHRPHLLCMRIWEATRGGEMVWCDTKALKMLPGGFSMDAVKPYARLDCPLLEHSDLINRFVAFCRGERDIYRSSLAMSLRQLLDCVDIPQVIQTTTEVQQFRRLMDNILGMGSDAVSSIQGLQVFDANGRRRDLGDLFDHEIPLFSNTLSSTTLSNFVHPLLRSDHMPLFRRLGLKHSISIDTLDSCARAVQNAFYAHQTSDTVTVNRVREMARATFDAYRNDLPHNLPASVVTNPAAWSTLDSITFVETKRTRRQGAPYDVDQYFSDAIPILVSPSECVLEQYEPIAWTQRKQFLVEPGETITALHKALGVPSVSEVVQHLEVLACKIATDFRWGNWVLLADIKATYKWLDERSEEAREHLLSLHDSALFLNVDDPSGGSEPWDGKWLKASQLLLNVDYDQEGAKFDGVKRVRKFLQSYPNLLRAAGSDVFSRASIPANLDVSDSEESKLTSRHALVAKAFNEMRVNGLMTDVFLIPENDWPIHEDGPTEDALSKMGKLGAHRSFLAASVEHFRHDGWGDSQSRYIRIAADESGIKEFLNFIYTGSFNFELPMSEVDANDRWQVILDDLLKLLDLAESIDMKDLRAHIETCIIEKYDLVHRILSEHDRILENSQKYNAKRLEATILALREQNSQLMKRFSIVESNDE